MTNQPPMSCQAFQESELALKHFQHKNQFSLLSVLRKKHIWAGQDDPSRLGLRGLLPPPSLHGCHHSPLWQLFHDAAAVRIFTLTCSLLFCCCFCCSSARSFHGRIRSVSLPHTSKTPPDPFTAATIPLSFKQPGYFEKYLRWKV